MRLIASVCVLALSVSACAETEKSRSSEIDARPFAELAAADCEQVRATMREAVAARSAASEQAERAGGGHGAVFSVVTAFVPIPGLGLLRRAATAAAESAEPEESAEAAETKALYRAAQESYREKGCGAQSSAREAALPPDSSASRPDSAQAS